MSKSRFEYVKQFESEDNLLPNCWIVIRIDGSSFGSFVTSHEFAKPVDARGVQLMDRCAQEVMRRFGDIIIAYGHSDENSFVLRRDSVLFSRRSSKLNSSISSSFSAFFVFFWSEYFPNSPLQYPPSFDGRCVCYPTDENLKDYLSWRQVDCHINNLFNTAFWNLVLRGGHSPHEARTMLRNTTTNQLNDILFSRFTINYNNLPEMFRRGSLIFWHDSDVINDGKATRNRGNRQLLVLHEDFIQGAGGTKFWEEYSGLIPYVSVKDLKKANKKKHSKSNEDLVSSNESPQVLPIAIEAIQQTPDIIASGNDSMI